MAKEKWSSSDVSNGQINGLFDKGCSFAGKLAFNGIMQVNGKFEGEIHSEGTLVVGPDALIQGKIKVDTIIIDGCLEGELEAKNKIELRSSGRLLADIATKILVVEEGGIFQGSSKALGLSEAHVRNGQSAEPVFLGKAAHEQEQAAVN